MRGKNIAIVFIFLSSLGITDFLLAQPQQQKSILVMGHRGSSALRPEHTLASYSKAIADGADFIEPDLVPTKDGVLVARHENNISDTTNISEHPEFASCKTQKKVDDKLITGWFVEDFTLQELKTLRAKQRLPKYRSTEYDNQFEIPTFDEIIEFIAAESATSGKIIGLIPEIKYSSYFHKNNLPTEDTLLATLKNHSYTQTAPIIIQSFEMSNLKYLKEKIRGINNIQLMQLIDTPAKRPGDQIAINGSIYYRDLLTLNGLKAIAEYADYIAPDYESIIPFDKNRNLLSETDLIKNSHQLGLKVVPYTFCPEIYCLAADFIKNKDNQIHNRDATIQQVRRYIHAGIDGFFIDDPSIGRQAVDY